MANSFSASFPEIWAREQQEAFYKTNVAMKIADTSFKSDMSMWDTLNRPYRSSVNIQTYTPGTSITIDDRTDTNEQLSVNKKFATGFYMDDFDKIQSKYDLIANYAKDDAVKLSNQIDADVLGEVANATSTVDAGSVWGTSGNGISLSTSNVLGVMSAAKKALYKQNVDGNNLYAVISPEFEEILTQYIAGKDTMKGDKIGENGFIGSRYGFDLYRSNQSYGSVVLSLATQPTNTDTVVINGVTFTFVTSIGTTAGNVLIGADADAARLNLTTLINAPATTTATGVALSTQNARLFAENCTAVNDASANTCTISFKGVGVLEVSETLTDATDGFTAAKEKQHLLFGVKWNPTLVVQSDARVRIRDVETKLGVNILNGVLYGVKTFVDNAKKMVSVDIQSDGYSA